MPIVEMDRLRLIGLPQDLPAVLALLSRFGAADIRELPEAASQHVAGRENERRELEREIVAMAGEQQRLAGMILVASDLLHIKKPLFTVRRKVSLAELEAAGAARQELTARLNELDDTLAAITRSKEREARLLARQALLEPWRHLVLQASDDKELKHLALIGGSFADDEQRQAAIGAMDDAGLPFASETIYRTEHGLAEIFAVPKPLRAQAERVLHLAELAPFPAQTAAEEAGDYPRAWAELQTEISAEQGERQTLEERARELAANRGDFELLHDWLAIRQRELEARRAIYELQHVYVLQAYVPRKRVDRLLAALNDKFTIACEQEACQPAPDVPVLLENHKLLEPYEEILTTFSLPLPGTDVDPIPVMGPFYAFYFGMMLSDTGYGLLLALLTGWLIWGVGVERGFRRMCLVLFQGSIVSMAFGFVFGGFFGNALTEITGGAVNFPTLWFNPMDDPVKMMLVSVATGVVHVFASMGLSIYARVKRGEGWQALTQVVPWYLILLGLGLLLTDIQIAGVKLGTVLAVLGAAVILFFGSDAKNPLKRIFSGLGELYGVTGYLSDFLSYTRILALSLATGVIALVVNMMAMLVGWRGPQIIFFAIIMIFGHGLNLALSALSSYVHTTRLHYVEFFSRSLEGGGSAFDPLTVDSSRYTRVEPQE
ncbi:MAG: hypothetical protein QM296_04315 [Bacillota bacterium]|nr:hypothetical protein [Bacillota bacterium]